MSIQGKTFREVKICCQFVACSGCIRMHLPAFALRDTPPLILREFLQLRRFAGNRWRRRSDSNRRITVCKRLTEPAAWQWIKGSAILFRPLGQGQQRGPGRRARVSGSVIRFSALDSVGSVELLKQDHEGQLMLHRHGRERPYFVATIT